jgi:hypothetical protein
METNFTPGPWALDEKGLGVISKAGNISGDIICDAPDGWEDSMKLWGFNAALIAAAPDLFEALRLALPYIQDAYECAFPDTDHNANVLSMAQLALSKAIGQPHFPVINP